MSKVKLNRQHYTKCRKGRKVVHATLPVEMINKVESELSDHNEAHRAIHLLQALYPKFRRKGLKSSVEIAYNYIEKVLNGNSHYTYLFYTKMVREWGIFIPQENEDGTMWKIGQAIKYKLNPEYLKSKKEVTIYYEMPLMSEAKAEDMWERMPYVDRETFTHSFKITLKEDPTLIEEKLRDQNDAIATKIRSKVDILPDGRIRYVSKKGVRLYNKTDRILNEQLHKEGANIKDRFVSLKTEEKLQSALRDLHKISSLANEDCFPTRDKKSGRMYNIMTNIDSILLPHLQINGEDICEIDMANCQFTLLAHIITHAERHEVIHIPTVVDTLLSIIFTGEPATLPLTPWVGASGLSYHIIPYLSCDFLLMDKRTRSLLSSCFNGVMYETTGAKVFNKKTLTKEERDKIKYCVIRKL